MAKHSTRSTRVLIRRPKSQDQRELTALAKASKRFHAGLVSPPCDAKSFRASLERWSHDDSAAFLICRREDEAIVGMANFSQIFHGPFCSAYLGYWIGEKFARQGYMTEGLALALDEAFGPLRLHRVEANLQPQNTASRELVKRLGFRQEGYSPRYLHIDGDWRDHERWAILKEEWEVRSREQRAGHDDLKSPHEQQGRTVNVWN